MFCDDDGVGDVGEACAEEVDGGRVAAGDVDGPVGTALREADVEGGLGGVGDPSVLEGREDVSRRELEELRS